LYQWWPTTFTQPLGQLQFGFTPPQARSHQRAVKRQEVAHLPLSLQFLAISQKSLIPYLPIQTEEEKQQYKQCIGNYKSGSSYDFTKMAEDWNHGELVASAQSSSIGSPDGVKIRFKLSEHLEVHFRKTAAQILTTLELRNARDELQLLEASTIAASSSISQCQFQPLAIPMPIQNPVTDLIWR
jgi:hypothetical protein